MVGSAGRTKAVDASDAGDGPFSTEDVLRTELASVLGSSRWTDLPPLPLARLWRDLHGLAADQRPSALCLSGGGIRSATFCLGVLQWLAQHGKLQDFHYLSTVSGGGYIGSWLVNGLWQAGRPFIDEAEAAGSARIKAAQDKRDQALAAARQDPSPATDAAVTAADLSLDRARSRAQARLRVAATRAAAASANWLDRLGQSSGSLGGSAATGAARSAGAATDPVAPLRGFSNYLSPAGGLSGDAFSLAAIFVRNLLLNALVWLSLLAAIVALPRLYIAFLGAGTLARHVPYPDWLFVVAALGAIVWGVAYIVADLPQQRDAPTVPTAPSASARQAAAALAAETVGPRDRFIRYCFAPIVGAAIVLSIGGAWIATLRESSWWWFALAGAGAHLAGVAVGVPWRIYRGLPRRRSNVGGVIVVVVVGACGGALASVALSQLGATPVGLDAAGNQRLLYATFAVPAMTGAFWLAMVLYAGLMGRFTDEQDREWWARATAYWLRFSLIWVTACALMVWLPLPLLDHLGAVGPTALQFGVGGGLLGVVTSLIGYWSQNGEALQRKAWSVLRKLRIRLLDAMAVAVVVATLLALSLGWSAVLDRCHGWAWTVWLCPTDLHAQTEFLREQKRLRSEYAGAGKDATDAAARAAALEGVLDDAPPDGGLSASAQAYRHVLLEGAGAMLLAATVALLVFSAALALLMGVNVFSLHGMYGNRLVRAYLGSGRARRRPHWFTGFDAADNPQLAAFEAPLRAADGRPRLYPVVNIALNMVRAAPDKLDWQQRKAAPFVATPRHCGAAIVGFRPTDRYLGGMSLGRAMTISGAAASPNMGYHSSAPVTFVMALFNVRLGWWAANPGPQGQRCWSDKHPWVGLDVALAEATGRTGVDDSFVYLSDGGHFDNLGIYEMVRRRCRRIVAVDATCDGRFQWGDLLDVVRKIRVDLGIPIVLPSVLPGSRRDADPARFIEATICYSARDGNAPADDGTLIVLKPRLLPQRDPPELAAYAAASAADGSTADDPARFPHQSTADQFFDELQFESYRLLGYTTAEDVLQPKAPTPSSEPDADAAGASATDKEASPAGATAGGTTGPEPAHPCCARNGRAGAGGLAGLFGPLGAGAALAGALTIGVVGTVTLAPSEIRLSDADRALLARGLKLSMDADVLKLNDADRELLNRGIRVDADGSALTDPARRLSDAAEQLFRAAQRFESLELPPLPPGASAPPQRITVTLDPALQREITGLRTEILELNRRIRANAAGGGAPGDDPGLTSAVNRLRGTLESINDKLPGDATSLAKALSDLQRVVDGLAPRRNVRGHDGGTR